MVEKAEIIRENKERTEEWRNGFDKEGALIGCMIAQTEQGEILIKCNFGSEQKLAQYLENVLDRIKENRGSKLRKMLGGLKFSIGK